MSTKGLLSKGDEYNGFVVTKNVNISELQCSLIELQHRTSGARVLHIGNDDPENFFSLSFRTMPENSHGTAHVLEHTALCGSKKFPVRDPFFSMNRRSLNTFMNAMTGADFTCYPAASQVPADFYNLLEVYLDAVFNPKLEMLSFLQEGHRLEFSMPENPVFGTLTRRGIVYNEMKGAMSSPDTRLSEALMRELFPSLTYHFNSGGDPKEIPLLTYEELINFHKKYYHPSRCLFFFYGSMPLERHLDFIADNALHNVAAAEPLPPIPRQERLQQPVRIVEKYPAASDNEREDTSLIAMGFLTCSILEQTELLALQVLDLAIMGTDAAPLKRALLESGFCKEASSSLDNELSEVPFSFIMHGCNANDVDAIEALVMNTLKTIAEEGIPGDIVDASIHQIEFHRSEITGDGTPFGLSLFFRSALLEQHGCQPEDGIRIHSLFKELRQCVKDRTYLPSLIKKHFINNSHYIRILMVPDTNLAAQEQAAEDEAVHAIEATLSEREKAAIVGASISLKKLQESREENLEVLPKISLTDIPILSKEFPLKSEQCGGITVYHHECFTNDIIYADIVFDLPSFSVEELPAVRLFSLMLSEVGCSLRGYKENLEYIQEHTGGIAASLSLNNRADDHTLFLPTLSFGGKALRRNGDKLFTLLAEMVKTADFSDVDRIKELLLQHHSELENSLNSNALRYAINLSCEGLSNASYVASNWYGIRYLLAVRNAVSTFEIDPSSFITTLKEVQKRIMSRERADLIISCNNTTYADLKAENFYGLKEIISAKVQDPWHGEYSLPHVIAQGRIIAAPVAFTTKAFDTVSYTDADAPLLSLASLIFNNKTLHKRIREQGGAYGGGSSFNATAGTFYFYSYRDPNIATTLAAFDESITAAAAGDFSSRDLEDAKLGIIQSLDSPVAPGSRAFTEYSWMRAAKPIAARTLFRERILSATEEDVRRVVAEYIMPRAAASVPVIFAGADLLKKENACMDNNLTIMKIETIE